MRIIINWLIDKLPLLAYYLLFSFGWVKFYVRIEETEENMMYKKGKNETIASIYFLSFSRENVVLYVMEHCCWIRHS